MSGLVILDSPDSEFPEADRFAEAPHPAAMLSLVGHTAAEAEILGAIASGRMHHAWLISGEPGIGKATFAYRIARFLLAHAGHEQEAAGRAATLDVPPGLAVAHQIAAQAHPDLAVIRRGLDDKRKALKTEIAVSDVWRGLDVFLKTASGGGYRICIVDCCDELNANGANALLKMLEEPPVKGLFLLIANRPGRLLPTIRSRCRSLKLRGLAPEEVATVTMSLPGYGDQPAEVHARAAALAHGSVQEALAVLDATMLAFHDRLDAVLASLPELDGQATDAVAEACAGKTGREMFHRFCESCLNWLSARLAEHAESPAARLALTDAWSALNSGRIEVDVYNLDRRPFVFAVFETLAGAARAIAR